MGSDVAYLEKKVKYPIEPEKSYLSQTLRSVDPYVCIRDGLNSISDSDISQGREAITISLWSNP